MYQFNTLVARAALSRGATVSVDFFHLPFSYVLRSVADIRDDGTLWVEQDRPYRDQFVVRAAACSAMAIIWPDGEPPLA